MRQLHTIRSVDSGKNPKHTALALDTIQGFSTWSTEFVHCLRVYPVGFAAIELYFDTAEERDAAAEALYRAMEGVPA